MEKVVVAMSGGVDSSLVAALLKEQGYEVIGVTMLLSEEGREGEESLLAAVEDAKAVAGYLGIRHEVADFRKLFREKVIEYFLDSYAGGITPNPCIVCNQYLKFGAMLDYAGKLGAGRIATGHYARVIKEADGSFSIRKGIDEGKDQSYVLYRLKREELSRIEMPLGSFTKDEVRELAERYQLPVSKKPESQEICFVPQDDYKAYLQKHRPSCLRAGKIVDLEDQILGTHQGVPLYTIGQRKGLGIAAESPRYVVRLDVKNRKVIVGGKEDVFSNGLIAGNLNWLAEEIPRNVLVKIRYGKKETAAAMTSLPDGKLQVEFSMPQRAVTPGQSVVFYDGNRVLGGGFIEKPF